MCGLTGMIDATHGGFSSKDAELFFGLLLINSQRGHSSTGLVGINKQKQADVLKVLGNPYNIQNNNLGYMFLNNMVNKYWAVIGHGRFPTQGDVSIKNAHPFTHKHITLVHNGTLKNLKDLNEKYKQSFEVDSEMICWLISEYGLKKTIEEIDGAYALIFYNAKDDTYNVIRNAERPLWYGINDFKDRLAIGSEKHYLTWADAKTYAYKNIKEFETHTHYTIRKEHNKIIITTEECKKPMVFYGGYSKHSFNDDFDDGVPSYIPKKATTFPPPVRQTDRKKTIVCVGEDLIFEISKYTEIKPPAMNSVIMVEGYHEDSLKINVFAETAIPIKEFDQLADEQDQMYMVGKVEQIFVTADDKGTMSIRVYIKDPKFHINTSKVIQLNQKEIVLKHNTKLSMHRFLELSKEGCMSCKKVLLPREAKDAVLYYDQVKGQKLLCGECQDEKEKGKENAKIHLLH